ncbi:MAG: phage head completion protein [Rhizomicrobium sp.]
MFGSLNQRAAILARDDVPDGGGGSDGGWATIGHTWVGLAALSGADVFGPDAAEARVRYRIASRRNGLLVAGNRLAFASRTFQIQAVLDDGAPSQLIALLCEEVP